MAKHKIKSFPCLFLALCALLLVDFPDKSNVASPVKPQKQHDGINIEEEVKWNYFISRKSRMKIDEIVPQ